MYAFIASLDYNQIIHLLISIKKIGLILRPFLSNASQFASFKFKI